MDRNEPCNICGSTGKHLIDGFYYCVECGTQDANVQETVVEFTVVGDGVHAISSRKRITQIPKAKEIEMTDDWYKWHSLNFILRGLADELIENGAEETFKTKLLWIWTRYMKKFQKRADFGLVTNNESDKEDENADEVADPAFLDVLSSDDDENVNLNSRIYAKPNIKKISMQLIIAFLYAALNIDKSHIQLTDLLRFAKEERISIINWQKLVPKELRPKKLSKCLLMDLQLIKCSLFVVRTLCLDLFRELNLGNPVVPDIRMLVDRYFKELCLPDGLKRLVISLMHHRSFDYLDINTQYNDVKRVPSYELFVMAHILMALKICFGLDTKYEMELSEAVDKINEIENHPVSYNSEPTDRIFCFREWASYIQFRKSLLHKHTLYLGASNYLDMDDYVTFEHLKERKDYKILLNDEIAHGIINKIPGGDVNTIPKSEFVATLTPNYTYTQVILQHQQDRKVKELLSEDFTQYSVKYFMKDMFLVDLDSTNPKNLLTGISRCYIHEHHKLFNSSRACTFPNRMVYVKHCDNHNWTVTSRPQMEHVTKYGKNEIEDKEKDHGYVSNSEVLKADNNDVTQKGSIQDGVIAVNNEVVPNKDFNCIMDIEMETENVKQDDEMVVDDSSSNVNFKFETLDEGTLKIREEDDDKNIFDDIFINLESKVEDEEEQNYTQPVEISEILERRFNHFDRNEILTDCWNRENDSDASSVDSIRLNPESLDRIEAIKELIIHACDKYRVSIPGKYVYRSTKRSRRDGLNKPITRTKLHKSNRIKGFGVNKINDIVAAYHSQLQHDVLNQMSGLVHSAIADFNKTKDEIEMPTEPEVIPHVEDDNNNEDYNQTAIGEDGNENLDSNENPPCINEQSINDAEADKYNLFGDSSDGEINAEDLLAKKNPEFDEKTHDITQLYIKPVDNPDIPQLTLNPKLFEIIDKAIAADDRSEVETPAEEQIDSEEELSLSVLHEQKLVREQLTKQIQQTKGDLLKHLLPGDNIPKYNYWVRHYSSTFWTSNTVLKEFAIEIDTALPTSFVFVLKECAYVAGYPTYNLYHKLQETEMCIKDTNFREKKKKSNYRRRQGLF